MKKKTPQKFTDLQITPVQNLPPSNIPHDSMGVSQVYQSFPTDLFCQLLQTGQEIRILNTWAPNLHEFKDLFTVAIQRQARIRILLLNPLSLVANLRNDAIKAAGDYSVQRGVDENFATLREIYNYLNMQQRNRLEVRLYNSLPSISIYQVDQLCFMGIYFHGELAIRMPQLVFDMTSFLGKQSDDEFNKLWEIAGPIHNINDWRHEADLLR
jgi:hypothetical protein